jgi:hypothetical protein
MKKQGKLNTALREIVRVDHERRTLLSCDVLSFNDFKQLKAERRRLVATIETAPRGQT